MTTNNSAGSPAARRFVVIRDRAKARARAKAIAIEIPVTPGEPAGDQPGVLRIEQLPRDVGWLLVYVGVLGVVLPGIVGTPFLIVGGAILFPGGPKLLSRWASRNPPRVVQAGMKQISRLVYDLERRYPRLPRAPS